MKIKVLEASGAALDWMVAKAQGFEVYHSAMLNGYIKHGFWVSGYYPGDLNSWVPLNKLAYSTDWQLGGPILDHHISHLEDFAGEGWSATCNGVMVDGDTALIAVYRAYVMSKLGDEVEVPDQP